MMTLKRILLPTDFSDAAKPAVDWACGLAESFEAELHVLHVMANPADRLPEFGLGLDLQPLLESWESSREQRELDALERLTHVLDPQWKAGRQTTIATRTGNPFVEIVRYAKEHAIDVIVMGTHGRTGLKHALLGSVAENVLRVAPCPVLTVRPREGEGHSPETAE